MAPRAKNAKAAFKAMENLGYSEKIVRPIVKELLKLYDDNWILIEEDNYRVLIDAILESEEHKARSSELEQMNAWSEDEAEENEPILKRSKRSSQKNQSSPSFHASIPNCSNEVKNQLHDKQKMAKSTFKKHEDKDIELKASYVPKYCHGEGKTSSADERDESNSLVPFVHLENSEDESDSHHDFSEKRMGTYQRGDSKPFGKGTDTLHEVDPALEEKVFDENLLEATLAVELLSYDLPGFEVPLSVVPPDSPRFLLLGSSYENCSNAKESCSIFPEVIDLDAEDPSSCLLFKDAYSIANSSGLEGIHSESMNNEEFEEEKNECDIRDPPNLEIASSSSGEVKISLSVNSSLRSDFHVPNLEAVLKQVEQQWLKLFRIPQTGFSMLRLMKEVCECFWAAGTTSTYTEDIKLAYAIPSPGICKYPNSETGSAGGFDNQLILFSKSTTSNDPIMIQNIFELPPQIPRLIGSIHLDLTHCKIYLSVDVSGSRDMEKNVMELSNSVPSSSRMMFVEKQQHYYHYVKDITKGEEAQEISLINEINEEQGPTFNYISENVTYQNAYVRFLLARISEENCCSNCSADCLSLEIPCTCAVKNGHEFTYTPRGIVKETFLDNFISGNDTVQQHNLFYCQDCPLERSNVRNLSGKCKGHLARKFIKECWHKCGCSMKCGNRVVQRGITAKLQVFMTPEKKGWGLRTLEDIPKGAFICEYVGEVVTTRELFERNMQNTSDKHTYPVLLDADWSSKGVLKDEEALCLDSTAYGNVARFINHRCFDANLVDIPVEVETPDCHYYHLAFFTTRNINALEEITWDYRIDFNDNRDVKAFQCCCGSKFCRDRKSVKRKLIYHESR